MRFITTVLFLCAFTGFLFFPADRLAPADPDMEKRQANASAAKGDPTARPDQDILSLAYARHREGNYREGARILETFLTTQIEADAKEAALVLLADCYYHMIDENPKVNMQLMLNAYKKVLRLFPDSPLIPKDLYRIAETFYKQKMFQKAIFQYRKIIHRYPDSSYAASAMFYMGRSLIDIQEEEKGLKVIQAVIEKYPAHPVLLDVQSYLIAHDMKLEKYQEVLQRFTKISPDLILVNPDLRQIYLELMSRFGRYKEARDIYFKLLNIHPDDPLASRWMAKIGDTYAQEKKGQDALKIYYQTQERFRGSEGEILARAGILDVRYQEPSRFPFQKIIEGYDRLLSEVPKGPLRGFVVMRKARILYQNNSLPQAIALFSQFFQEYPESPYRNRCEEIYLNAFSSRIRELFQQGKYPSVVDLMQQNKHYLTLKKVATDVGWMIAESHYQVAFFHTAAAMMEELVRLDERSRDNETLLFELGETHLELGEIEQSMEILQDFLERFPESPFVGDVYALKGRQAFLSGDIDKTIAYCNTALDKVCSRRVADAYFYLGCAYREKGEVEHALEMFQKTLDNEKKPLPAGVQKLQQSARFALGDLLYDQGRKTEAMKIYQDAVQRYPGDENADWARYRMALIQADRGNTVAALKTLQGIQRESDEDLLGLLIRTADSDIRWHQKVAKVL